MNMQMRYDSSDLFFISIFIYFIFFKAYLALVIRARKGLTGCSCVGCLKNIARLRLAALWVSL